MKQRGSRQSAWHIVVSKKPRFPSDTREITWDSGKVVSDSSVFVPYRGLPLESRCRYYWKIRFWDEFDHVSPWSESSWWEMGLLSSGNLIAKWIGGSLIGGPYTSIPAPFLRKSFILEAKPIDARLYVSALGVYEASLNGQKIGNYVFAPGWTDYRQRVAYQTYDVTSLLQKGENVLGAILGDGWYCGFVGWKNRQVYGTHPKLLAQLEISFSEGRRLILTTDSTWRVHYGPILENDFLMGESYDARLEMTGWNQSGFDASHWMPVQAFPQEKVALCASAAPPVRRIQEIAPIHEPVAAPVNGSEPGWTTPYIFDFGQNLLGRVRLRVTAPAGTTLRLRHGEALKPDGTLYTENLRSARATDFYTCRGGEEEIWEPRFTFHGFRYVELQGLKEPPTRRAITAVVLHTDMEPTGKFSCSSSLLNQLQSNIQWGQRSNMLEVPTDCPQRDERLGWTGDAQVFVRTASFNMDVSGFFAKWQQDVVDAQLPDGNIPPVAPSASIFNSDFTGGPGWSDAVIICPWILYQCYGDQRILERSYGPMQHFVQALENSSPGLVRCHPDLPGWKGFGDWLALDGGPMDGATPKDLLGTAYFAHSVDLLGRIARLLQREMDAARYENLFRRICEIFRQRFIATDGTIACGTQTAYVLALHFNLVPEAMRPAMVQKLVADIRQRENKLSTGFLGTPHLLHVLSAAGQDEIAYKLLFQEQWPSWLYAVKHGATTIWERWDGWTEDRGFQDVSMNSFNHYAYGAVGDWMYRHITGIDLLDPGYKRILLRPQPQHHLTHAEASLQTGYGTLALDWKLDGTSLHIHAVVPPNTTAVLEFPPTHQADVIESGTPVEKATGIKIIRTNHSEKTLQLNLLPGTYDFQSAATLQTTLSATPLKGATSSEPIPA